MKGKPIFMCVLIGLAAMCLLSVAIASEKGSVVSKAIEDYRQGLFKEAREQGGLTPAKFAEIHEKVRVKASEAIRDVDPARVPADEAYDWALVYAAAKKNVEARSLLRRFLNTNPEPSKQLHAHLNLATACIQSADFEGAYQALMAAKAHDEESGLLLANNRADNAESLVAALGRDKVVALLEAAERALPAKMSSAALDRELTSAKRGLAATKKRITMIGGPAPSLKSERGYGSFPGLDGLKGKIVIIDFFAHWCGPCIASYPDVRKMYDELKPQGLEIVGVTTYYGYYEGVGVEKRDMPKDTEFGRMADFISKHKISWPVIFTDRTQFADYGVTIIPHVTVIDRRGTVRLIEMGYTPEGFKKFRAEIEKLLKE